MTWLLHVLSSARPSQHAKDTLRDLARLDRMELPTSAAYRVVASFSLTAFGEVERGDEVSMGSACCCAVLHMARFGRDTDVKQVGSLVWTAG